MEGVITYAWFYSTKENIQRPHESAAAIAKKIHSSYAIFGKQLRQAERRPFKRRNEALRLHSGNKHEAQ